MKGGQDFVCIRRLGKIMNGAEFDGLDRGGDRGIAGEHHNARVLVELFRFLHQLQPGRAGHLEVDHRVLGRISQRSGHAGGNVVRYTHCVTTLLQGLGQHRAERGIVIHQQQ